MRELSSTALYRALKGLIRINLDMEVLSGLLIRMPVHAQVYRIGGADQYPMITKRLYELGGQLTEVEVPLIPGSSLKGRMRSLLEISLGKGLYSTDDKIWLHARIHSGPSSMTINEIEQDIKQRCDIDEIFGAPALSLDQLADMYAWEYAKQRGAQKPSEEDKRRAWQEVHGNIAPLLSITRLLVDDMYPTQEYVRTISENGNRVISIADFLEEKSENRIDRITSAADPRQVARVKPGVVFSGTLKLLMFDIDSNYIIRNLNIVARGLRLVEETYLGASGSRGYGRVKFKNLKVAVAKASDPALKYDEVGKYGTLSDLLANLENLAKTIEGMLFK